MKPDFIRSTFSRSYKTVKRFMIGDTTERRNLQLRQSAGVLEKSNQSPDSDVDIQGEILGIHRDWMPLLGRWY